MLYRATHVTRYLYEDSVSQCVSQAHLRPRSFPGQTVRESRIRIRPQPVALEERTDYFGNHTTMFALVHAHTRFVTTATSIVEVAAPDTNLPSIAWEQARHELQSHLDPETLRAYEFTFHSPFVPWLAELRDYALRSFLPGRPLAEAALDLSHRIHTEFRYEPKSTEIDMPLASVFRQRRGVCQDFSHVMIGCLRALGLAARYVSGYLRSGYQGAEASHAWIAVFLPGYGWLNLDPTNDVIPAEGHITVAWGRDFGDVTPVKGIALGGGKQTVEVEVRVRAIRPKTA